MTLAFLLDGAGPLLPDLVKPWQMCSTAVVTLVCCCLMPGERRLPRFAVGIAALWAGGIAVQVVQSMYRFDLRVRWSYDQYLAAIFVAGFPLLAVVIGYFFPRKRPVQPFETTRGTGP